MDFLQVVQGLSIDGGMNQVRVNGDIKFVDGEQGEAFRQDMLSVAREAAKYRLQLGTRTFDDQVTEAMMARMIAPTVPIRATGWLMLNGAGLFMAKSETDEMYDVMQLDSSVNLFGMVLGAGYGEYPYVDPDAVTQDFAEGEDYEGEVRSGPTVVLDKVMICEADGIGSVQEVLDKAIAPFVVDSIRFHHVLSPMRSGV